MQTFPPHHKSLIAGFGLLFIGISTAALGQSPARKINPYAPSPAGNSKLVSVQIPGKTQIASVGNNGSQADGRTQMVNQAPLAQIVLPQPAADLPTNIYRIGVNDVLKITLSNVAAGSSSYSVRRDGTIDFPLAGDNVIVKGLTVNEVITKLNTSIKLFADPRVEVEVSEYASHTVTVSGKVRNPGTKFLRREAVPLFVIKAEAMVDPDANAIKITTYSGDTQTLRLSDTHAESRLIHQGMSVEFTVENFGPPGRYFISVGQTKPLERPMSTGLTLSKAAAMQTDAKKTTILRQDNKGKVKELIYDLREIMAGKSADPLIEAGDVIRIRN